MASSTNTTNAPRMSDEAVKAKTGKNWKEWFAILDKAGAKKMTHQEIVKVLHTDHGVGSWWQQMMAVTYEEQRGLRDRHEKLAGYQISVSRTVGVSVAKLYKAFATEKGRARWLAEGLAEGLAEDGLVVRTATANKSMRVTWKDGKSSLEISFLAKGDKSQVVVQHSKLASATSAAKMKTYWGQALDRLRGLLEN